MKMFRSACVIAALLVLAGRTLPAQEPLFGSEAAPKVTRELGKIPLAGGTWKIQVSRKGMPRLVQIVGLGAEKNITAELACAQQDPKPMQVQIGRAHV